MTKCNTYYPGMESILYLNVETFAPNLPLQQTSIPPSWSRCSCLQELCSTAPATLNSTSYTILSTYMLDPNLKQHALLKRGGSSDDAAYVRKADVTTRGGQFTQDRTIVIVSVVSLPSSIQIRIKINLISGLNPLNINHGLSKKIRAQGCKNCKGYL